MTNLDSTLGITFVGNVLAGCMYGIASVQAYTYFRGRPSDTIFFRTLLFLVWLADTIQLIFVTHALYYYMVTNYDNPIALLYPDWSILVFATCISGAIVRGVFTRRVWLLTGRNNLLAGVIALASISTLIFGSAFAISGFSLIFADLRNISYFLYTALASGVAADVLIATSLCVSLSRRRTGFKRTNSLINVLMLYAINSSLLTSLCSIASLVTFALWPTELIYVAVFFLQSKLYTISLFASINNREYLKENLKVEDVTHSLAAKFSAAHEQDDPTKTAQSVMVTIEHQVEVVGLEKDES